MALQPSFAPAAPLLPHRARTRPRVFVRSCAPRAVLEKPTAPATPPPARSPIPTAPGSLPSAAVPAPTPLVDAVQSESKRVRANFFAPGHKQGALLHPSLRNLAPAFALDLPELPAIGELSASHGLHGPIGHAESLYARRFPGYTTRFLTGGSTSGVLASLLATAGPGTEVLLPRNAHQSAVHALALCGATPVWLAPASNPGLGLQHVVRARDVEKAFADAKARGTRVAAVMLLSPTYHGVVADVPAIAKLCREARTPLIVDEAHGAHFGLCDMLPESAAACGADLVVQSAHKTLPALASAALLHVRTAAALAGRVDAALRLVATTSPSALSLVALDAARAALDDHGERLAIDAVVRAHGAVQRIEKVPGLRVLRETEVLGDAVALDPTRVTILLPENVSGFAVDDALIEEFGVYVELPAFRSLTLMFTLATRDEEVDALIDALQVVVPRKTARAACNPPEVPVGVDAWAPAFGEMCGISPRDAFFARTEIIPADCAAGRISADTLCPYPPGIPVVVPGERISATVLDFLREVLVSGGNVSGAIDEELSEVRVLCEDEVRRLLMEKQG